MSIHAVKAVEIGTGVANAASPAREVHDEIYCRITTAQAVRTVYAFALRTVPAASKAASPTAKSFASAAI